MQQNFVDFTISERYVFFWSISRIWKMDFVRFLGTDDDDLEPNYSALDCLRCMRGDPDDVEE